MSCRYLNTFAKQFRAIPRKSTVNLLALHGVYYKIAKVSIEKIQFFHFLYTLSHRENFLYNIKLDNLAQPRLASEANCTSIKGIPDSCFSQRI